MKRSLKTPICITLLSLFLVTLLATAAEQKVKRTVEHRERQQLHQRAQKPPQIPAPLAPQLPPQVSTRGLWVQFENTTAPNGYWPGQIIQYWTGPEAEITDQIETMKNMGVNTITIELRTSDPCCSTPDPFPYCGINWLLGLDWPQPPTDQLMRLENFFSFLDTENIRVILVLVNTHMEEEPPANSEAWLGSILNVVKDHP